ncbi:serine protease inhibitor Cvsi-2-like [Saccostrea echinata]|uniref:serine protease inhibitor Cvsi-2-like n=1 Tax=Saccostrea echinata TaxID=191078 RepID=UPI002A7EE292|nr:serine protease inhibitor Cvsi-2-like [Saccostrea echinata]
MRTFFILAILVAAVYSEDCRRHEDCTATTCASGSELHCVNHQCTCTTAGSGDGGCTMADDCHGRCDHGGRHHCIDGRCRCTHF